MKTLHILLVEDNEADIFYTTEVLEDTKIVSKISVARDGKEAINFLNKTGESPRADYPDLILLDINIPKKNGHEVLKYIKTSEKLKHITVVMLSTSSTQVDIDRAYKNHANGYLTKPLGTDDLLNSIEAIGVSNFFYSEATHYNNNHGKGSKGM
ncbi:MAG: response regulator [Ginsengibacter sp.]